ncbi:uncharacterized protein [Drosophila tropicalis]|uniref:uncharacterized protein n=1 Tax=Drosophila tropicalis TaxID=46794 RepID=UPI0035AC01F0
MSESSELPSVVTAVLLALYQRHDQPLAIEAISGVGENSYGQVVRVSWPTLKDAQAIVVKIAPQNIARRAHMHVVDYYKREVFMYESVFPAYMEIHKDHNCFGVVPKLIAHGLQAPEEFLVFEDLTSRGYVPNARSSLPTYEVVTCTLKALADLHSKSFALQKIKPDKFAELVAQLKDNLFTPEMETVTIEFGKVQLRRTRQLLQGEIPKQKAKLMLEVLNHCEKKFKELALHCVAGMDQKPYSVICHGDFWNNNILYKHEAKSGLPIDAILIDFQMSRYASPILDIVYYLFTCTDKPLRDDHFMGFLDTYYNALDQNLASMNLRIDEIYPRKNFKQQLHEFGVYGLIMAAFAMPFFISKANEIVDIDEVSEAIQDLSTSSNDEPKCRELVEEFDMLNERTLPIFKRRMTDVVVDLIKYEMIDAIIQ